MLGKEITALLILIQGTRCWCMVTVTTWSFYPPPQESRVTTVNVFEWAIEPFCILQRGKFSVAVARNLTMTDGYPACSLVTVPVVSPCHVGRCYLLFVIIMEKVFWHVLKSNCFLHHVCLHRTGSLWMDFRDIWYLRVVWKFVDSLI
jgi:hypothetical protein